MRGTFIDGFALSRSHSLWLRRVGLALRALRSSLRLLAVVLVTAASVQGQEALYTLKVDVPWVAVDVTITDANGRTVPDLKPADFEVFENGIAQRVQSFNPIS